MEILPKVDEAAPPIGMTGAAMESHYKEELLAIVWSPRGGSSAAGEGGSVVGICGAGLWCWLVGDTREPQWCFRDFKLANVDR